MSVSIRLTGQDFLPADVSAAIKIAPTRTWRVGDSVQGTAARRKHDGWEFALAYRASHDANALLCELLDILEPHAEVISKAAVQFQLKREVSFGIFVDGEMPACWFSANTLHRLAELEADLDIDIIAIE